MQTQKDHSKSDTPTPLHTSTSSHTPTPFGIPPTGSSDIDISHRFELSTYIVPVIKLVLLSFQVWFNLLKQNAFFIFGNEILTNFYISKN